MGAESAAAESETAKPMSKRQRLKQGLNEGNTWVQHPRIHSPAARARVYLVDAGLHNRKKDSGGPTLDPELDLHSPEVQFGRMLGGTDQKSRHRAVIKLQSYLRSRCDIRNEKGGISELDFMKLWKGLWYTLYMADKVPVQEELSKALAELIWCVAGTEQEDEYAAQCYLDLDEGLMEEHAGEDQDCKDHDDGDNDEEDDDDDFEIEEIENTLEGNDDEGGSDRTDSEDDAMQDDDEDVDDELVRHCRGAHLAALFVRTFFRTVKREWGNLDKHRVDKFYTAIRLMIAEVYKYMSTRHWNLGIIRLFNDPIFEEVLSQTPNGLRYHLVDICLEELAKVNKDAPTPLTEATVLDCLEPFFAMLQTVSEKLVHKRVMDNIMTRFLMEYSIVGDVAVSEEEDQDDARALVMDQVHVGSVAQFIFEIASDPETNDRYRTQLYDLHKTYMRRIKKVGTDLDLDEDGEENFDELMEELDTPDESQDNTANDAMPSVESSKPVEEVKETAASSEILEKKEKKHKKKKKKKSEKKTSEEEAVAEDVSEKVEKPISPPVVNKEDVEQEVSTSEKKKHKKKKKKKTEKKVDKTAEEEVITISTKEQKKAAKRKVSSEAKSKESTTSAASNTTPPRSIKKVKMTTEEKRVKFGQYNHSKSWKASMKDLTTMKQPSTASRTPEKGILMKSSHVVTTSEKKKRKKGSRDTPRKKATDYF